MRCACRPSSRDRRPRLPGRGGRRSFHGLVAVAGVGFGLTAPFTALLVVGLGARPEWAAYVVASMGLSLLLVDAFGTRFVPRLDSRIALAVSMLVFGIGSLLSAATTDWVVVGLARVLQGFGGALFMGGGVQAAVRLARAHERGGAIGSFNAAWFAGIATGPLGAGSSWRCGRASTACACCSGCAPRSTCSAPPRPGRSRRGCGRRRARGWACPAGWGSAGRGRGRRSCSPGPARRCAPGWR
ncbi:MFS transporter [Pseudonocardia benzenivorans]